MINTTFEIFKKSVELIKPLAKGDNMIKNGEVTIEQFVDSGDKLIKMNPKWYWCKGTKLNKYLPTYKQFLMIKEVKCHKNKDVEISLNKDSILVNQVKTDNNDENIIDDDLESLIELEDDDNCVMFESDKNNEDEHYYDIYIVYDFYFNTPRIYLFGYNINSYPLSFHNMMKDMQEEYINNTLTLEKHPHLELMTLSLHPCKHASTMKNLISNLENFKKNLYLMLFLKIISSLIPKLEYDVINVDF